MDIIGVFIDYGDDADEETLRLREVADSSNCIKSFYFKPPARRRYRDFDLPSNYLDLFAIYGFFRACLQSNADSITLFKLPKSLLSFNEFISSLSPYLIFPGSPAWIGLSPKLMALSIISNFPVIQVTPDNMHAAIRTVRRLINEFRMENKCSFKTKRIHDLRAIELPCKISEVSLISPTRITPKIAVLFLLRSILTHKNLWVDWAQNMDVRFFCHVKNPNASDKFTTSILIPRHIDTCWGHISIVRAMLALLEHAVHASDCTHFIFASESCIPIARLKDMLMALSLDGRSRIGFENMEQIAFLNPTKAKRGLFLDELEEYSLKLHSQWVLLSRSDSEAILQNDMTTCFENVFAPDESYFGTLLRSLGKSQMGVHEHRITWDCWETSRASHPKLFDKLEPLILSEILSSGCFFARKFAPNVNMDLLYRIWS